MSVRPLPAPLSRRSLGPLALGFFFAGCAKKPGSALRVAAASDLARAFDEVGRAFASSGGGEVVFTFGSTGLLSRQIAEGAPFDLLAAANAEYIDDLVAKGHVLAASRALYARGRVVAWTRDGGPRPPETVAELADARFRRISLANPDHAPYGRAAREALASAGILAAVQGRLVFGENVQQAMQFAKTGDAEVALVARSLSVGAGGSALVVDEALHRPLDQALGVCARSARVEAAKRFASFVTGPEGQAILARFGFSPPGPG